MSDPGENFGNVDPVTRARAGSLSAHGLSDQAIADLLLLSMEQISKIKESPEFKNKYSEEADVIIQRQIEMDEGWDVVEEKALAHIITALEYNRDPKYALFAAQAANRAQRRAKNIQGESKTVINQQTTNNVIMINVNKKFVEKIADPGESGLSGTIDITPRQIESKPPLKTVDLPSPKQVENLLAPVRTLGKNKQLTEIEKEFENAGVSIRDYIE